MNYDELLVKLSELSGCIHLDGLGDWWWIDDSSTAHECIDNDPLQDLSAMHEAEKRLNATERFNYFEALQDIMEEIVVQNIIFATARQRAEAFVKTLTP